MPSDTLVLSVPGPHHTWHYRLGDSWLFLLSRIISTVVFLGGNVASKTARQRITDRIASLVAILTPHAITHILLLHWSELSWIRSRACRRLRSARGLLLLVIMLALNHRWVTAFLLTVADLKSLTGNHGGVIIVDDRSIKTVFQTLILLLKFSRVLARLLRICTTILALRAILKAVKHQIKLVIRKISVDGPDGGVSCITTIRLQVETLAPRRIFDLAQQLLGQWAKASAHERIGMLTPL